VWSGVSKELPEDQTQVVVAFPQKYRGQTYIRIVAIIRTAPDRTEAQAIRIGKRIRANIATLDKLRSKPGVIDHRADMPMQPFFTSITAAANWFDKRFGRVKGGQTKK